MTASETRFLLKRLARLIVIAEYLASQSPVAVEDQQMFDMLKAEIETINGRLQKTRRL